MKRQLIIHPDELTYKWIDRMHAIGVDTLGIHSVGGKEANLYLQQMIDAQFNEDFKKRLDYAVSLGMDIEYELHAASYLLPREMFETHPDYFRMNESGERTNDLNFCVSNSEALAFVTDRAVELASKLYKSSPYYYFWLDDAKDSHCHCPECQKLSASDQQLLVMNAILRKLKKFRPEAKLAYLAYVTVITPPSVVKPEEGIFVEYAPIDRRLREPASIVSEERKQNIRDLLAFFGTKDSKLLEYWYDNSYFSGWKKPPKPYTANNEMIRSDIEFYKQFGFEYYSSFACYLGPDFEELYGEPDISAFQ